MGYVSENDLIEGIRGRVGNKIVFRKLGSRTIASRRPSRGLISNDKQLAHQERFKLAAQYAKAKMLDPAAKAMYDAIAATREATSSFAIAVGDFLKAPEIKEINTGGYTGKVGDVILVKAIDDVKVTSVKITIAKADGTLIETGASVLAPGEVDWKYVATQVAAVPGVKITVAVTDFPGNTTTLDKVL
jgi:hypothetical protein